MPAAAGVWSKANHAAIAAQVMAVILNMNWSVLVTHSQDVMAIIADVRCGVPPEAGLRLQCRT